ncbi:MAG: tetratricopeptide repeat protein [Candidatus Omnitrophota bacterium]
MSRNHAMAIAAGAMILAQAGCATIGPVTNFSRTENQGHAVSPQQAPATPAISASPTGGSQPHPTEILVEDGLAELIKAEQVKSESIDLWIERGNDKRYLRFRNPFLRMQWDIVSLRLQDPKEHAIKLGTKLESRFETLQRGTGNSNSMNDMKQVFDALSPMISAASSSVSYGGGGYGGGFGGSAFGAMGQFMEGIQKINAYEQNKIDTANRNANETYIDQINEMFIQDGFAVTSIRKGVTDFSLEKPDYIVEEVWKNGAGGIFPESFRVYTGEGHLLFQTPYHQTYFGISLFIRSKMVTGEIDIKSEKYAVMMQAVNLWETGDAKAALAGFQKALAMDPEFVNGYRYRAKFYEIKERWQDAIADLTRAIGILRARLQVKVLFDRGQLYWKINDYDAAIKDFDHVLAWEPKAVWVQASRGFCWLEKQDLDRASSDFESVLAQDPKYDVALTGRAWVWALRGEYEKAIELFNQVLATSPNYANALRGRGYCYKMLKEKTKASNDLTATLQQLAKDPSPIAEKRRAQIGSWLNELRSEVPVP